MWFIIDLLGAPADLSKRLAALTYEQCTAKSTPKLDALPAGLSADQVKLIAAQHDERVALHNAGSKIARETFERTRKYVASELPLFDKDARVGVTARYQESPPGSMELVVSISEHP